VNVYVWAGRKGAGVSTYCEYEYLQAMWAVLGCLPMQMSSESDVACVLLQHADVFSFAIEDEGIDDWGAGNVRVPIEARERRESSLSEHSHCGGEGHSSRLKYYRCIMHTYV